MKYPKSLFGGLFHNLFPVEPAAQLDERVVAVVLEHAWVDNCTEKLYFARGAARRIFNETVGEYVRAFWKRTGRLPEGYHEVVSESRRIYFAPLASIARKRANVSTIRSADGASA